MTELLKLGFGVNLELSVGPLLFAKLRNELRLIEVFLDYSFVVFRVAWLLGKKRQERYDKQFQMEKDNNIVSMYIHTRKVRALLGKKQ